MEQLGGGRWGEQLGSGRCHADDGGGARRLALQRDGARREHALGVADAVGIGVVVAAAPNTRWSHERSARSSSRLPASTIRLRRRPPRCTTSCAMQQRPFRPVGSKSFIDNCNSLIKKIILHANAGGYSLHQKINTFNGLGTAINRACG